MNSSVACDSGCPFPPIPPVLCSGKCSEKLIRNLAVSVIAERLVPLLCQCFPCLSHSKPLYYWPKPLLKIEIFSFFFYTKTFVPLISSCFDALICNAWQSGGNEGMTYS